MFFVQLAMLQGGFRAYYPKSLQIINMVSRSQPPFFGALQNCSHEMSRVHRPVGSHPIMSIQIYHQLVDFGQDFFHFCQNCVTQ